MIEYTAPEVFTTGVTDGWAEPETDPTRCDWRLRQAVALLPFRVVAGRPVTPGQPTGIERGRNGLGRWGENPMADAVITCTGPDGRRWLLLIEREDGHGWAVPGGAIEPGESPAEAAARELAEETGLVIDQGLWEGGQPQWVPDPRGSDEAWAVTVAARAYLGRVDTFAPVRGADDARRARWVGAADYADLVAELAALYNGEVFPAHVALLLAELGGRAD
jgi:8-oxo-dGTP pyrophosphatase MutT (NUDIX family)